MYRPRTSNYDYEGEDTVLWAAASPEITSVSKGVKGQLCIWTPAPNFRSRWPYWCERFGDYSSVLNAMDARWGPRGWVERTEGDRWHPQPQPHLPSPDELFTFVRFLETRRALEITSEMTL